MPGVGIETIGCDPDHLHMVMVIPLRSSIAVVLGRLKRQSSSPMRKTFGGLQKVYWNEPIVWSPGSFVSSVGVDEGTIKRYIEHQGRQDSGQFHREL
jgi:putative transposase